MDNKTASTHLDLEYFKLVLKDAFKEKDFDTLITYLNQNEIQLLSDFLHGNSDEIYLSLITGSFLLNYFEEQIKADSEKNAIFKLGELNGYIHFLESILYEDNQNKLVNSKFEKVLSRFPNHTNILKKVVIALSEKVEVKEQELLDTLSISLTDLKEIIKVLEEEDFIYNYTKSLSGYALTDLGLRLIRQLKNDTYKNL